MKRSLLIYFTLLAFAWFATVSLREHWAFDGAVESLRQAAALAERSSSNPAHDEALARLLAESFGFNSISFFNPQGIQVASATLPRGLSTAEKFLQALRLVREVSLQAPLQGDRQGTIHALWLNLSLFGHLGWLLIYLLLAALLYLRERLLHQQKNESEMKLETERRGRIKAESELSNLQSLESLLASISSHLGSLEARDIEDGIADAVRQIGSHTGADRSALVLLSEQGTRMSVATGWHSSEAGPGAIAGFKDMPSEAFPWLLEQLKRGQYMRAPSVASLPEEASGERGILMGNRVRSMLAVPVTCDGELLGFLTHSHVRAERDWSEEMVRLLRLSGEMLGGAIRRMRQHELLSRLLLRESLLSKLSSSFLRLEGEALDSGLVDSLMRLGQFCGLGRASVFQIHTDGERVSVTHEWCALGMNSMQSSSQDILFASMPGLRKKVLAGEAWKINDAQLLDDGDGTAEWKRRGAKSWLAWPMVYKNISLGFLLFERPTAEKAWNTHEIESARQSAELMAQLLARQRSENALRLSESRLRSELIARDRQDKDHEKLLANLLAIFNAGSQSIVLISRKMEVEAFNKNAVDGTRMMFGRAIQAGMPFTDFLPAGQRDNFLRAFNGCMQGLEMRHNREVLTYDGKTMRFHIEYLPVFSEDGEIRSVCFSLESLDELRRAELALQESEERFALAARGSNDGLWDWNLVTGKMFFSERWCEMTDIDAAEAPRDLESWLERLHPEDREAFRSRLEAHLSGQTRHFECEYRILHRSSGEYAWMYCRGMAVRDAPGKATRIAGSQTDVSLRKRSEERQELISLTDPLTGLPNRSLVLDRLGRSLSRKLRSEGYRFAALLMDTDNFKMINDSLGHELGDELLIAVARRLEDLLRPGDTVGRMGGDEFVLLLEDLSSNRDALAIAERIHDKLNPVFRIRGNEIFVTLSIGIAISDADVTEPEEMLRDAETAMYRAKALGPSRHIIFDSAMHRQAISRLEHETDLHKAVQNKEFELYYQPLVRLSDQSIYGFEALLRWNHPVKGMIAPSEFIPLAEETRQIIPLGQFVIEEACRQLAEWTRQGHPGLSMNINLSVFQLARESLGSEIATAIKANALDPRCVTLEITESVLMDNPAAAAVAFENFKALGVKLAIDDFGTGYSSLSYLQRFPVDVLKIDRSFVSGIDGLTEHEAISSAIITMGKNLKIGVVAEGIENNIQRERLLGLGCEMGQGYFFSRPLAAKQAFKRLRQA